MQVGDRQPALLAGLVRDGAFVIMDVEGFDVVGNALKRALCVVSPEQADRWLDPQTTNWAAAKAVVERAARPLDDR